MRAPAVLLVGVLASWSARAQDAGTFTLFTDYGCDLQYPNAPPWQPVDGGWLAPGTRRDKIDCGFKGAQGELDYWRPKKGLAAPEDPGFKLQPSHGIVSLIIAALTAELAVIKSRADQHCKAVANPFAGCH